MKALLTVLIVLVGIPLFAQTYSTYSVGPVMMPLTATDVVVGDVKLSSVTFSNIGPYDFVVNLTDKQSTPTVLMNMTVFANTTVTQVFPDRLLAKGGVRWYQQGLTPDSVGTQAVTGQVSWRTNDANGQ